jgi:Arc/MetJ family transcription regulator
VHVLAQRRDDRGRLQVICGDPAEAGGGVAHDQVVGSATDPLVPMPDLRHSPDHLNENTPSPIRGMRVKVCASWQGLTTSTGISGEQVMGYPVQGKEVEMAKTLIDVNEEDLAAAAQALNTATKKDTVNAALRAVAALAARRRDLRRLVSGGLPDLEDAEVMRAAWQR